MIRKFIDFEIDDILFLCQFYFYKMEGKFERKLKAKKLVHCRLKGAEKSRYFPPWHMARWACCCCVGARDQVSTPQKQARKHQADIYSNAVSSQPGTSSSIEARVWDAEMLLKTVADKDVLLLTPATCRESTPERAIAGVFLRGAADNEKPAHRPPQTRKGSARSVCRASNFCRRCAAIFEKKKSGNG